MDTRVKSAFSEADRGESVASLLDALVDDATAPVDTVQVRPVCLGRWDPSWDPTSHQEDEPSQKKAHGHIEHNLKDEKYV